MTTHTPDPIHPASGDLEAVARIILSHVTGNDPDELIHYPWQNSWDEPTRPRWTQFIEAAIDIAALRPAVVGEAYVTVPREPTADMLDAARYFWGPWLDESKTERAGRRSDDPEDIERARQVWEEMIEAAPVPTPASHDALIARVRELEAALSDACFALQEEGLEVAANAARALLADLDAGAGR